jgi:hypothetical protein
MSPTFDRSKRYQDNFIVGKGNDTVYLNENKLEFLRSALKDATDDSKDYIKYKNNRENPVLEVENYKDGVEIRSKYTDGSWNKTKLSYNESRELIGDIDKKVLEEAIIEEQLKKYKK